MSNAYTTKLVQFAIAVGTTQAAKQWLVEHAPTMRAAEKIEADRTVVMALAKKYGIEATESTRPLLSGLTFSAKGGDDSYKAACNCANVALSKVRGILLGKQKAEGPGPVAKALALLAKKIGEGDKEAIRAAKKLVLLIG